MPRPTVGEDGNVQFEPQRLTDQQRIKILRRIALESSSSSEREKARKILAKNHGITLPPDLPEQGNPSGSGTTPQEKKSNPDFWRMWDILRGKQRK